MMNNDIHSKSFENKFLRTTEDFFRSKEFPVIESNDKLLEYLKMIAEYFNYEIIQARTYLEKKSTLSTLIFLSETIFFPTDILSIIVGKLIVFASDENNYQELTMLFELIHGSPEFKNEFLKLIETHVYQKAIESINDDLINNPLSYIETIVNIHAKYLKLIEKIFVRDQSFDKGYAKFINQNPVSKRINIAMTLAEILARYCDTSLRKGYLNDKDIFMKFYQKMLRKRLIDQLSVSESYEETLVSEFKKKCGYEYTSKLEQMIKDIRSSEDLTQQYRTHQKNTHGNEIKSYEETLISEFKKKCGYEYTSKLEQMIRDIRLSEDLTKQYRTHQKNTHGNEINFFSVMVLSSNCWLFSQPSDIILPIEFKTIYDNFTTFYLSKHTGRKLTLLHQYSKGELQINFTTKKHRVQVSTYQMMILLLFNQELILTFEQIQDKTQICSELLFEILPSLLKSKLLISNDPLTLNSRIKLAENFIRPNEQKDQSYLMKTTIDERQMIIQATLVRIMKKERTLKHSLLIQQVIQQLTSNFKPDISLIKNPIYRDTFTINPYSYVIVRFKADNLGIWMLHCHNDWHLQLGMATVIVESPTYIKEFYTKLNLINQIPIQCQHHS
ncbi:unnamed protein product [Adineta steineri]|uniref:Cullin family profile domain-containing protein n=1 Tax=Adineta steineri TaxID=433720 RepID=A0A813TXY9_9BILA|nr:unnamed protein product [Adineta steineri]